MKRFLCECERTKTVEVPIAIRTHTKWEMSMSWRSLKQNILIEFGKRMTLWILLTQKKIDSHYFWKQKYRIAGVIAQPPPCTSSIWIRFLAWKFLEYFCTKVNFSELKWFPRRQQNNFVPFESTASQNWLPNHFEFYAQLWRHCLNWTVAVVTQWMRLNWIAFDVHQQYQQCHQ